MTGYFKNLKILSIGFGDRNQFPPKALENLGKFIGSCKELHTISLNSLPG